MESVISLMWAVIVQYNKYVYKVMDRMRDGNTDEVRKIELYLAYSYKMRFT